MRRPVLLAICPCLLWLLYIGAKLTSLTARLYACAFSCSACSTHRAAEGLNARLHEIIQEALPHHTSSATLPGGAAAARAPLLYWRSAFEARALPVGNSPSTITLSLAYPEPTHTRPS